MCLQEAKLHAPLHVLKLEFRLDEIAFNDYLKEVDRQLCQEVQSFGRNENPDEIVARHKVIIIPKLQSLLTFVGASIAAYWDFDWITLLVFCNINSSNNSPDLVVKATLKAIRPCEFTGKIVYNHICC
jgi:hypothetical protein